MSILVTVVTFLLLLSALIIIHELGHFFTARAAGVKVLEFGFGFPPRLFGIKRGEVLYSLNAIPLGGFVKMLGEEDPSDPRSLASKSIPIRTLVISAGALMNLILAMALFSLIFAIPRDVTVGRLMVDEVAPGTSVAAAGIQAGDIILEFNGRDIDNYEDLLFNARLSLDSESSLVVEGVSGSQEVTIVPTRKANASIPGAVKVEQVHPGSPAALAGLQPGDTILEANGIAIYSNADLREVVTEHLGEETTLLTEGVQGTREITLVPRIDPPEGQGALGITLKLDYDPFIAGIRFSSELLDAHIERRSEPIWKAIPLGIKRSWETLVLFKKEVFSWISGDSNPEFSGPIGIAQITGEVASAGIVPLIAFTALLSLNLAILNILPIPALDGGRLLFIAIEVIRGGKRIKPEREALVHMVGFMMLILLIIIISYNDILRIIQGDSLLR